MLKSLIENLRKIYNAMLQIFEYRIPIKKNTESHSKSLQEM